MPEGHSCGPDQDVEFFNALNTLFNAHPEMAKKYAVSCVDHETDIMNIDFRNTTQIARIENNSVSITNMDRAAIEGGEGGVLISNLICCKWWRESDSTWTCLQRWDHAIIEEPEPQQ